MRLLNPFIAGVALALLSVPAFAAGEHNFGVGFVLGAPTALSLRADLSATRAFDAQLAINEHHFLLVYGDYLLPFHHAFRSGLPFLQNLTPYMGFGALVAVATRHYHDRDGYFDNDDDRLAIAARIPFGLEWRWTEVPIGIGFEIAPGIVVAPSTEGFLQGDLTLRYYF